MSDTMSNSFGFNAHQTVAKPLYIQRLESSLNIDPFISYAQEILSHPLSSSEDSDSDVNTDILAPDEKILNGIITTKCGNLIDECHSIYIKITKTTNTFQIVKMINYKSIIYHKLDQIESGYKIFY